MNILSLLWMLLLLALVLTEIIAGIFLIIKGFILELPLLTSTRSQMSSIRNTVDIICTTALVGILIF